MNLIKNGFPQLSGVSLEFELLIGREKFTVKYESDSKVRNRIMSIYYHGYSLDVTDFMSAHHDSYTQIMYAMRNNAESYWEETKTVAL